jgi:septal ring factor EnvC (AmiA/AmiB activator)
MENVIMVEHNQKMISVLLGDMKPEVDESTLVTQGSIIGKLNADRDGGYKTLYYEIRREDQPVPALSYLKLSN